MIILLDENLLQQLLIKPTTKRVAGRSPAIGFIFLFVAGLKANCCKFWVWVLSYLLFTGKGVST